MNKVNVFEVKARLSEYLDRAARGERIVICRHNKPVAELRALDAVRSEERPIGPLPGRPTFEIPASFFDSLPEDELDEWEGRHGAPEAVQQSRSSKVAERRGSYQATTKKKRAVRGRR